MLATVNSDIIIIYCTNVANITSVKICWTQTWWNLSDNLWLTHNDSARSCSSDCYQRRLSQCHLWPHCAHLLLLGNNLKIITCTRYSINAHTLTEGDYIEKHAAIKFKAPRSSLITSVGLLLAFWERVMTVAFVVVVPVVAAGGREGRNTTAPRAVEAVAAGWLLDWGSRLCWMKASESGVIWRNAGRLLYRQQEREREQSANNQSNKVSSSLWYKVMTAQQKQRLWAEIEKRTGISLCTKTETESRLYSHSLCINPVTGTGRNNKKKNQQALACS